MEMEGDFKSATEKVAQMLPKIEELNSKSKVAEPKYKIIKDPPEGTSEFLVIEITLPGIKTTKDTTLDVGEDRLVLLVNPAKYHLNLELPFDVNNETCGAQFNRQTKILTITLPVLSKS